MDGIGGRQRDVFSTPADSVDAPDQACDQPSFLHGLDGILRAGRHKAATDLIAETGTALRLINAYDLHVDLCPDLIGRFAAGIGQAGADHDKHDAQPQMRCLQGLPQ